MKIRKGINGKNKENKTQNGVQLGKGCSQPSSPSLQGGSRPLTVTVISYCICIKVTV